VENLVFFVGMETMESHVGLQFWYLSIFIRLDIREGCEVTAGCLCIRGVRKFPTWMMISKKEATCFASVYVCLERSLVPSPRLASSLNS